MGKGSQIGRLSFLKSSSLTSSLLSLSPEPESWKSSSWGWQAAKHSFLELKLLEFPCKISLLGNNLLESYRKVSTRIYLTAWEKKRNAFLKLWNVVEASEGLCARAFLWRKTALTVVGLHIQSRCHKRNISTNSHQRRCWGFCYCRYWGCCCRCWECGGHLVICNFGSHHFRAELLTILFCVKVIFIPLKDHPL